MRLNVFEFGRRLRVILYCLIAFLGAVFFYDELSKPFLQFATTAPDAPWTISSKSCNYPDHRYTTTHAYHFRGLKSQKISLCFRAGDSDRIAIKRALPPEGVPVQLGQSWYETTTAFSNEMYTYADERAKTFVSSSFSTNRLRIERIKVFIARLIEQASYTALAMLAVLITTNLLGWLFRGLLGVPSGQDFRSSGGSRTE